MAQEIYEFTHPSCTHCDKSDETVSVTIDGLGNEEPQCEACVAAAAAEHGVYNYA